MPLTPVTNGMSGANARTAINACFTKVDTVETGADVTNLTNVGAALTGATITGVTSIACVNFVGGLTGLASLNLPLAGGTLTGALINSTNGAVSAPVLGLTGTTCSGGTATTTKPTLLVEPTGTTSTGWSTTGTLFGANAATGFTGNLLDVQLNGVNQFKVTATGSANVRADLTTNGGANTFGAFGWYTLGFYLNRISGVTDGMEFGNTTASKVVHLYIDASDVFAQRRGTNAQTSRVYGTYTDASNYVRASLAATSTLVTLAAQTAGTGADNIDIDITTAGTGLVNLATQSASVDAAVVSTHTARIKIGGTEYKILLATP